MKILITGVRGFTGPYLRAELESAGHEVIGTVFDPRTLTNESILDIHSLEACREVIARERPDVIFNLAGIAATNEVCTQPYYATNVIGAENLLRACCDVGHIPKKIILVSSSVVYGIPSEANFELSECAPLNPVNHYGISKLAMELVARTFFDRLPILIVRPFNYVGRGQGLRFVTAKIVDHFRRGAPLIELGNVDVARDFSDVRDVVGIYGKLMQTDAVSDVVNVCSGRAYPLRYLIDTLEAYTGHRLEVRVNPKFVRANDPKIVRGSTEKLSELLGPIVSREFDDTIEWMADWIQEAPAMPRPAASAAR